MKKETNLIFSIHISISLYTKFKFIYGDKIARLNLAKELPKDVLRDDVLKIIHEQVYILLSCNRRRANRVR